MINQKTRDPILEWVVALAYEGGLTVG